MLPLLNAPGERISDRIESSTDDENYAGSYGIAFDKVIQPISSWPKPRDIPDVTEHQQGTFSTADPPTSIGE